MPYKTILLIILVMLCIRLLHSQQSDSIQKQNIYAFDFGVGQLMPGYTQVLPDMIYNNGRGFGFYTDTTILSYARKGKDPLLDDFCTSVKPFIFVVDVPEGNYNIILYLGDQQGESLATIKAESRRLFLEKVQTRPGEIDTVIFTTNVRYSTINGGEQVRLKSREIGHPNWDKQLSVEFSNLRPCICAMEITRTDDAITLYLAGNSTVTDQQYEPWASWGQMLPRFFKPVSVSVANHAESGEALKSFVAENRLKKILSTIKEGDYLFIQFGHNDQKPESSAYVEPFTGYKEQLKLFIETARKHNATPVLITPMHRRKFDEEGQIINTHGDYPEAMRETAKEEGVALIDLHKMSEILYETLGVEDSKKAFVFYPAGTFPGQTEDFKDNSHFSNYGAYQLAKCILNGIKSNQLDIAAFIVDDFSYFNPAQPDPTDKWELPVSPAINLLKPEGN